MKTDLFEVGFFSIMFILLISIAVYVGYEVRGQIDSDKMDNIVIVKKCGKKMTIEH